MAELAHDPDGGSFHGGAAIRNTIDMAPLRWLGITRSMTNRPFRHLSRAAHPVRTALYNNCVT